MDSTQWCNRGQTTIIELKLFTDLIDALGKVASGLKAIVNLPKAKREFRLCVFGDHDYQRKSGIRGKRVRQNCHGSNIYWKVE